MDLLQGPLSQLLFDLHDLTNPPLRIPSPSRLFLQRILLSLPNLPRPGLSHYPPHLLLFLPLHISHPLPHLQTLQQRPSVPLLKLSGRRHLTRTSRTADSVAESPGLHAQNHCVLDQCRDKVGIVGGGNSGGILCLPERGGAEYGGLWMGVGIVAGVGGGGAEGGREEGRI